MIYKDGEVEGYSYLTACLHLAHLESVEAICQTPWVSFLIGLKPHFCTPPSQLNLSFSQPMAPHLYHLFCSPIPPFTTHPTSVAHAPEGTEDPVVCASDPVLRGQTVQPCNFVLWNFTYIRSAGEKRAPQKKGRSWKRQRMQESRCQSKSMNSPNPETSTTTCAGLPPLGSGTHPSRCVSTQGPSCIPSSQL